MSRIIRYIPVLNPVFNSRHPAGQRIHIIWRIAEKDIKKGGNNKNQNNQD
jgi:hypothetical protein